MQKFPLLKIYITTQNFLIYIILYAFTRIKLSQFAFFLFRTQGLLMGSLVAALAVGRGTGPFVGM